MRKKVYGQSKLTSCPFCGKQALASNSQGIPVCLEHKKQELLDLKCACGGWLDLKHGKWGPFFVCMSCGPINMRKALEMNPIPQKPIVSEKKEFAQVPKNTSPKSFILSTPNKPKEITVTSDELDFM